jgi:hypothetical protein
VLDIETDPISRLRHLHRNRAKAFTDINSSGSPIWKVLRNRKSESEDLSKVGRELELGFAFYTQNFAIVQAILKRDAF